MALIDAQTAAKAQAVKINAEQTLQVRGVLTETIAIEIPDGAGGWVPLVEGGTIVVLDPNNLHQTAYGNALIRVNKPVTTNAVGVVIIG